MAIHEEIPVPGMYRGETFHGFDELLYSEARYTQKGMTLPEGTQVWEMGEVMAEAEGGVFDGLYFPVRLNGQAYPHPTTGDDVTLTLGPAEGLLRHSVQLKPDRRQQQNLLISGIAKLEKVKGYNEAVLRQLGATISTRRSTFKF